MRVGSGTWIEIDGSFGEGGGQILRSALALSMVTRRQVRVERIRAGRSRPGLLRQHLTAVRAAAEVCGGRVEGDVLGSTELRFWPGRVRPGAYSFSIGTAGSTTLVLQTVLPALLCADGASEISIEGGTHNPGAPSVTFLEEAFLPLLARMGVRVDVTMTRHGFYPAGGGRIVARIEPATSLRPIALLERGEIVERSAVASVAGLPGSIAKRELAAVAELLGWGAESMRIEQLDERVGPGNVLSVIVRSQGLTEVFTGFGERGLSAEAVAKRTAREVRDYLASGAPVWEHLADQLILPMALSGGGAFRTGPLSSHASTNIAVVERLLGVRFAVHAEAGGSTLIEVCG
ncbi:MAG: RNA 3'-terminal phosphate cyclase [Phycisphaerales bacterium]|nr:RNA 3'-terminal phosphate cyclase [Phycisphaerales bacterium]